MSRVGILTFWWTNNNYGQLLQLYGLYQYLESIGHTPQVIRYNPFYIENEKINSSKGKYSRYFNIKKIYSFMRNRVLGEEVKRILFYNNRQFQDFRRQFFSFSGGLISTLGELSVVCHDYDIVVVGSDQVWNYFTTGVAGIQQLDAYTIHFGPPELKRISYAASFGSTEIDEQYLKRIIKNIQVFQGVSVREESARYLLEKYTKMEIEWVPDPSLLIPPSLFNKLIINKPKFAIPIFIYFLRNASLLTLREIVSSVKKKKTIVVTANGLYDKLINAYPSIREWLSYMYYSELIITNSFHGCVFSVLFHKNFYYIPLQSNKNGNDERIKSFLGRLGIEGRTITSKKQLSSVIANPHRLIDWESVDAKREEFVQVGKDFLAKHLGDPTT